MSGEEQETILKFLVVDDCQFSRKLLSETLRGLSGVRIEQAESLDQAIAALSYFQPDIVITDWDMQGGDGIAFVKRLRSGHAGGQYKQTPVIMVADRKSAREVEAARNSGIDEFVLRPFSTSTLIARVEACQRQRREFVESVVYVGPCRRRKARDGAPRRRLFDAVDANADSPDVQIKKGLARMYVERIGALLPKATDRDGVRDLFLTCAQLNTLSSDMGDALLQSAASSLFNYVKGVGADGGFNMDVVRAHLDAILQLAELPNSKVEIRQTVTRELGVMVTKKLRAASAA